MSIEETPPLDEVQDRFRFWRKYKPSPNAEVPKDLWRQAEDLAKKHGVLPVAKALGVEPAELRNRASLKKSKVGRKRAATEAMTSRSLLPEVIEVASISIAADEFPKSESSSCREPSAVLTMNNGASLTLYQQLGVSELTALVSGAGGVQCSS